MEQASTKTLSIERGLNMRQCSLLGMVENMRYAGPLAPER